MGIIFIDWSCFEVMTLLSGHLSVTSQAAQILLLNILALMFQVPYGF